MDNRKKQINDSWEELTSSSTTIANEMYEMYMKRLETIIKNNIIERYSEKAQRIENDKVTILKYIQPTISIKEQDGTMTEGMGYILAKQIIFYTNYVNKTSFDIREANRKIRNSTNELEHGAAIRTYDTAIKEAKISEDALEKVKNEFKLFCDTIQIIHV